MGGTEVLVTNQFLVTDLPYLREGLADILFRGEFGSIYLNRPMIDNRIVVGDLVDIQLDQVNIFVTEIDRDCVRIRVGTSL